MFAAIPTEEMIKDYRDALEEVVQERLMIFGHLQREGVPKWRQDRLQGQLRDLDGVVAEIEKQFRAIPEDRRRMIREEIVQSHKKE